LSSAEQQNINTWWRAAASVAERISECAGTAVGRGPARSELSRFRQASWLSQPPFHEPVWFERRLAQWGIDRDLLGYLLSDESLVPRPGNNGLPHWAARFDGLYGADHVAGGGADTVATDTGPGTTQRLLNIVRPLTREALGRVGDALRATARAEPGALRINVDGVLASLSEALDSMLLPAIARGGRALHGFRRAVGQSR